jgi:hypothetical protein
MATVYVQFSDSTETTVASVFGCPQDPDIYPNQAAIDDTDARYQAFINPSSTAAGKNAEINAQIDAIERLYIMNRGCREGWIAAILMQATSAGKTESWLLDPATGNPFYIKLKAVDTQIRTLRSQLR